MRELDIWDPFRHLRKMDERMSGLFEGFPRHFSEDTLREPLIDIVDKGKEIRVIVELPGVEKKDIELQAEENRISIKAKTSFEAKEEKEKEGYYFHERRFASFYRAIPLPVEIVPEKAKAEFKNAILMVTLPKKHPEAKPKGSKVEVK